MENITLYSSKVLLSESENNPDVYIAKFIICDFGFNKNSVSLNRDTIEYWMSSLKNKPLVGKIKMRSDGEFDFSGHNVVVVEKTDENGNKYQDIEFDTDAFGTFTSVEIENIDNIEYIVATAEIWKRFTRACEIIQKRIEEGTLHTSWEISVIDSTKKIIGGATKKIINTGRFIGHCLLSKYTEPAYDSSGLLEIASFNEDAELSMALSQDLLESSNINATEKEGLNLAKPKKIEVSEEVVENEISEDTTETIESTQTETTDTVDETDTDEAETTTDSVEENVDTVETSALTEWDLRKKITEVCEKVLDDWCWVSFHFPADKTVWVEKLSRESELDYVLFTYEVNGDEVTVSEPQDVKLTVSVNNVNSTVDSMQSEIESKNDAIVKSSEEIQSLKTQISELVPFKEKFEKVEQERIEAEIAESKATLISKYSKTGLITKEEFEKSEEIKGYVDALDEKALKDIVATRYMASLEKDTIETSEVETTETKTESASANLNDDEVSDYKSIMKTFLNK